VQVFTMLVYLITLHAYRSWNTDRKHVQRGQKGIQPAYANLAEYRNKIARTESVAFDEHQRHLILSAVIEICHNTQKRLHATAVTPNHVHVLCSWKDEQTADDVATKLKRVIGMKLSHAKGSTGNRWFSRGQDTKRIADQAHFEYLMNNYLPEHRKQNGIFWGEPAPD
jgi:REP element-mobilizing transposase RayT